MRQVMFCAGFLWLAAMLLPNAAVAGKTLDLVRANGEVCCGVSEGLLGFSHKDQAGRWHGLKLVPNLQLRNQLSRQAPLGHLSAPIPQFLLLRYQGMQGNKLYRKASIGSSARFHKS